MRVHLPALLTLTCLHPGALSAQDPQPEALALAHKVQAFAGGPKSWKLVDGLLFTVGERRVLYWDRRAGRVRVENLGEPRARSRGRFIEVMVRDLEDKQDLLQVPPSRPPQPRVSCYQTFINDSFCLLLPFKLLDEGVQLSIDPRDPEDAKGVQRLRLRFAKSAAISHRYSYVLHVESKSGRILQWDYYRSSRARPVSHKFEDYQAVGPLNLSLSRRQVGGKRDVLIRDVRINPKKMPKYIWSRTDRYLTGLVGRLKAVKKDGK